MIQPDFPRNLIDMSPAGHAKLAARVVFVSAAAAWPPKGGRPNSTRLRARAIRDADRVHAIES
jgi:hypothetical protein